MAKKTVPPKQVTKKHVAKQEKEAKQTRLLLTGAIAVTVIVVVLLGYVLIDRFVITPNKVIATATASSKKFDAPIIPAGAAISCDIPNIFEAIQAIKNINTV